MVVQKVVQTFRKMYYFALVHILLGETFYFSHVIALYCSCHGMRALLIAAGWTYKSQFNALCLFLKHPVVSLIHLPVKVPPQNLVNAMINDECLIFFQLHQSFNCLYHWKNAQWFINYCVSHAKASRLWFLFFSSIIVIINCLEDQGFSSFSYVHTSLIQEK